MFETIGMIIQFLPFIVIMFAANLSQRLREREMPYLPPALLAYAMVGVLHLFFALIGLAFLFILARAESQPDLLAQFETMTSMKIDSWNWLGWGALIPALCGLVLLLKPVRTVAGQLLAIDPANPVHVVSLSMTMFVPINLALTLGIGLNNLSTQIAQRTEVTGQPPITLPVLWTQALMLVLLAFVGAGWLTRRSLGEVMARLGIVIPTRRQLLIGIGWALVLVPVVMAVEAGARAAGAGFDQDVESLAEQLIGPLFDNPLGIISIGLAAAIGEEAVFRGAAQPRLGIVVTALLFALLHSNYGITLSTLIVALLGGVLGIIRIRYNTTTAMITHAIYNSTLALLAAFASQWIGQQ